MNINKKTCLIDVIEQENRLNKCNCKTVPLAFTITNTITGNTTGHVGLLFHYKNDTWYYDNMLGSTKVYPNKLTLDIIGCTLKHFSLKPEYKITHIMPLNVVTMFKEDEQFYVIPKEYRE